MESNSSQEVRWFLGVLMWKAQTASSFPEFQDYLAKLRHPIGESGDLFGPLDKSRVEALFDFYCEKQRSFGVSVDESAGAEFSQSLRALPDSEVGEAPALPDPIDASGPVITGVQTVEVAGDLKGSVINAPQGVVVMGAGHELEQWFFRGHLAALLYESFRIRSGSCNATTRARILELFHTWADWEENDRDGGRKFALATALGEMAEGVLGVSLDRHKLTPPRLKLPSHDHGSDMIFVNGGVDAFTGESVDPYYVSKYPVTGAQYEDFLAKCRYPVHPRHWDGPICPEVLRDCPVTDVSAYDISIFLTWLQCTTGFEFRLPHESEWGFAGSAGIDIPYPWGESWSSDNAVTSENSDYVRPVTMSSGDSPFGVRDLCGNAWELVSTLHTDMRALQRADGTPISMDVDLPPILELLASDPWWDSDVRVPTGAGGMGDSVRFVMKGGSWGGDRSWCTLRQRIWTTYFNRGEYGTFRLACTARSTESGTLIPQPALMHPDLGFFMGFRVTKEGIRLDENKFSGSCPSGRMLPDRSQDQILMAGLNFIYPKSLGVGGFPSLSSAARPLGVRDD